MAIDFNNIQGREPLNDYPWRPDLDRLLSWLGDKTPHIQAFCFDVVMSAAYIDATSGVERSIEQCVNLPDEYNAHIGFINMCAPCFLNQDIWQHQKAVKPQSGALGKLSSEIILRFVEKLYPQINGVKVIGGVESADALLSHASGVQILAEVKSAPLLTYPFLIKVPESCLRGNHSKLVITSSQLRGCDTAIYMHNQGIVPLGKFGDNQWPFKQLVDFFINEASWSFINSCINDWLSAREAYALRDRDNKMYYLANASGTPPAIARTRDGWPSGESISDGKTSAGMDRTDDIKKGIYQTLRIGTYVKDMEKAKTALISNLPAYRHGEDYVKPFIHMLWGIEDDCIETDGEKMLRWRDLRRTFDFIITLEDPILRGVEL